MRKVLFLIALFCITSYSDLKLNDAFRSFFWTQDSGENVKHGCYGYTQIDSINTSQNLIKYFSSFWLTYDWWHLRFRMSYLPTLMTFSNSKPNAIIQSSEHFENVNWFSGFKSKDTDDQNPGYHPEDHFLKNKNTVDTTILV